MLSHSLHPILLHFQRTEISQNEWQVTSDSPPSSRAQACEGCFTRACSRVWHWALNAAFDRASWICLKNDMTTVPRSLSSFPYYLGMVSPPPSASVAVPFPSWHLHWWTQQILAIPTSALDMNVSFHSLPMSSGYRCLTLALGKVCKVVVVEKCLLLSRKVAIKHCWWRLGPTHRHGEARKLIKILLWYHPDLVVLSQDLPILFLRLP